MEFYSTIKKNAFESVLVRWMTLEPIVSSEVSQKDKHYMLMHIYVIHTNSTDELTCRAPKETNVKNILWTHRKKVRVG